MLQSMTLVAGRKLVPKPVSVFLGYATDMPSAVSAPCPSKIPRQRPVIPGYSSLVQSRVQTLNGVFLVVLGRHLGSLEAPLDLPRL